MLKRIIVILVVLACAAGGIWWLYDGKRQPSDLLTLYGNVDIRQVDVGFRVGGRVTELFKEEGDAVKTGERLARLDAKPYEEVFDQAAAQLSMQEIELRKMVAGYRTEDIEQARATLSGAQAVYANAASNLRRVERLRQQNAVSQQSLDEARASYGDALSRRNAARELNLVVYGGECIQADDGSLSIIDFNDWPSFATCRAEAATNIAKAVMAAAKDRR